MKFITTLIRMRWSIATNTEKRYERILSVVVGSAIIIGAITVFNMYTTTVSDANSFLVIAGFMYTFYSASMNLLVSASRANFFTVKQFVLFDVKIPVLYLGFLCSSLTSPGSIYGLVFLSSTVFLYKSAGIIAMLVGVVCAILTIIFISILSRFMTTLKEF
ncbi:MAG: hypothetical protein Q3961_04000, partial [Bifidobacteriaceae bacterium]|nr:hypothetical protein [Bifidobacteriaceae bacterium]